MSNLLFNYTTFTERIKIESGDKFFPIWLLVNPKYPNDIADIWNPIMYDLQDMVFRKLQARINSRNVFIKDIVSDIGQINFTSIEAEVTKNIDLFRKSVHEHQPKLIFTFDAITNELVWRALDQKIQNQPKYWRTKNLRSEFEQSIASFDITRTNVIPLTRLNKKKKTRRNTFPWDEDNNRYYFNIASKLAERIIENKDDLNIWI